MKLDIMKLNSHIIIIKCIIFVFSDTLKIYDKKSSQHRAVESGSKEMERQSMFALLNHSLSYIGSVYVNNVVGVKL